MIITNGRKPLDHFLSGAIFGLITAGGVSVVKGEKNPKDIAKTALQGGVAASFAISTSNNIANKNYLNAAVCVGLGLASISIIESAFNKKVEK